MPNSHPTEGVFWVVDHPPGGEPASKSSLSNTTWAWTLEPKINATKTTIHRCNGFIMSSLDPWSPINGELSTVYRRRAENPSLRPGAEDDAVQRQPTRPEGEEQRGDAEIHQSELV